MPTTSNRTNVCAIPDVNDQHLGGWIDADVEGAVDEGVDQVWASSARSSVGHRPPTHDGQARPDLPCGMTGRAVRPFEHPKLQDEVRVGQLNEARGEDVGIDIGAELES